MSASKDTKRGTWKVYIRYIDWMGNKQIKTKRGFQTKKEALAWEREFLQSQSKEMQSVSWLPMMTGLRIPEPRAVRLTGISNSVRSSMILLRCARNMRQRMAEPWS